MLIPSQPRRLSLATLVILFCSLLSPLAVALIAGGGDNLCALYTFVPFTTGYKYVVVGGSCLLSVGRSFRHVVSISNATFQTNATVQQ
jgi:hypothetical protein